MAVITNTTAYPFVNSINSSGDGVLVLINSALGKITPANLANSTLGDTAAYTFVNSLNSADGVYVFANNTIAKITPANLRNTIGTSIYSLALPSGLNTLAQVVKVNGANTGMQLSTNTVVVGASGGLVGFYGTSGQPQGTAPTVSSTTLTNSYDANAKACLQAIVNWLNNTGAIVFGASP